MLLSVCRSLGGCILICYLLLSIDLRQFKALVNVLSFRLNIFFPEPQPPSPALHPTIHCLSSPSNPHPRTRTPMEKQFETLRLGFGRADIEAAIKTPADSKLALDIFR
ncbi:hypothetical protein SAY86_015451 [Trapa natans]|uniref:Uncharacterized protein n=1 Tax=Trapa natans TaxID=22666 RepID=A0AAN7LC04_TRANT|nr:hypothetical protein SAY86_015451 [Trapa natans]